MNCQAEEWAIQNKRREELQSLKLVIIAGSAVCLTGLSDM
jgi:hypothetical protein